MRVAMRQSMPARRTRVKRPVLLWRATMASRLQRAVWKALEVEPDDRGFERVLNLFLATLIVANVAAVALETVAELRTAWGAAFHAFELFSTVVFSVEYALRLWSCTTQPRYAAPLAGRLRFVLTPMALVDLVAVLPSLVPGGSLDLRFARALRLLRLARALKIARYSQALQTLVSVVRVRRDELGVAAVAGGVLLVCASSGIYFAEHEAQPLQFPSIPAALWWGVVTLTTVGYGDVYPVTVLGKLLASAIAILGIGLFALPAGILAAGFGEEMQRRKRAESPKTCPHCGREID